MMVVDVLVDIVGYATGRLLIPILSLNRAYAQGVRSEERRFTWAGTRTDENGRIEVEATTAGWVGTLFWASVAAVALSMTRNGL